MELLNSNLVSDSVDNVLSNDSDVPDSATIVSQSTNVTQNYITILNHEMNLEPISTTNNEGMLTIGTAFEGFPDLDLHSLGINSVGLYPNLTPNISSTYLEMPVENLSFTEIDSYAENYEERGLQQLNNSQWFNPVVHQDNSMSIMTPPPFEEIRTAELNSGFAYSQGENIDFTLEQNILQRRSVNDTNIRGVDFKCTKADVLGYEKDSAAHLQSIGRYG